VSVDTRRWCTLAVGSLVIAGLLSLAVVVGRLPILSRIIDDPLFFKRCLVVHVDLALVVWFYAFLAGLLALRTPIRPTVISTAAHGLAVVGVVAMLAGALVRGAQPVLANYVPVIDHPLFTAGLAAFFTGALVAFVHILAAPAKPAFRVVPPDASIGLSAAAIIIVIAAATWVSARAGLPEGLDVYTRAEFLAWGPGHVLQAANACAMLAVWLWLLERATGTPVLSRRSAQGVFAALVLPQALMPLLTARGTLDALYHTGATQLMRWTIFPAVLVVFGFSVKHLWSHRKSRDAAVGRDSDPLFLTAALEERVGDPPYSRTAGRVAIIGFVASAGLALLGLILGACIRGSTTLVPAHYHASLGAVTVAFMAAAYFVCDQVRRGDARNALNDQVWCLAKWQLALFGIGQTVFVLGFAIGGAYGLGRKTYAAEQHVRSTGEITGLIVMGIGGLVAVAGGLWFLFLVLREIRAWWRPHAMRCAELNPSTAP
jgi:cytochrome c oxidase subunit 1